MNEGLSFTPVPSISRYYTPQCPGIIRVHQVFSKSPESELEAWPLEKMSFIRPPIGPE